MSLRRLPTRAERASTGGVLACIALVWAGFAMWNLFVAPRNPVVGVFLALFALVFGAMAHKVFFGKARVPSRRSRHAFAWALVVLPCAALAYLILCDAPLAAIAKVALYAFSAIAYARYELRDRRR